MADLNTSKLTRIVIVGGGFGGVKTALLLSRTRRFKITLISDSLNFSYFPQLYHTATGGSRLESSIPLSTLFESKDDVEVLQGKVDNIDPNKKTVWTSAGASYAYDSLVLAMGNVTNYFGIAGMEQFSFGMKTLDEARELKHHLHAMLVDDRKPDHHYIVVGAGATGVEMAAALVVYVRTILKYHGINSHDYQVDIVEAAHRILPRSSDAYAATVTKRLEDLGVKLYTGKTVKATSATELSLDGESLQSHTIIWTAGVANNPFFQSHASVFNIAKNHKVVVDQYLQAQPDIYVIGDNANTPFSGLALTAINDAKFLSDHLMRLSHGHPPLAYKPKSPMTVIPVGTGWAAFNYKSINVYGLPGWILRRLGDFVAYRDIAKLVPATKVWLEESVKENECSVCDSPKKVASSHATLLIDNQR